MRLKGKVAVVTGAGSGFGAGIARRFAQEDAKLIVNDINAQGGARVAKEVGGEFVQADVTKAADWAKLVAAATAKFGRLDVVVNNAGWTHRRKPYLEVTEAEFDKVYAVNVKSIYLSALHALPVIVFSNLTRPGAVEEAWEAGATLVLSKFNTSPKQVLASVNATLAASSGEAQGTLVIDLSPGSSLPTPSAGDDAARGHILLVEASSDLNTLMAFLLRQDGHQVTGVKRSVEALQQVSAQSFDLFLLAQNSPDSGGLSLCKQLRQSHVDRPIVIYSTAALFLEQQEGLRAGATAYLVKPEDLFNVGQIASDLLSSRPARPRIQAA